MDSDRFRVIFEPEDANTAAEVLAIADSVFERITAYLDYAPSERIPVVIYGDTASANGYFSPYPPHVGLYVASPTGPWLGAQTESWIEALFLHELTHYIHLTRPIGLFGRLKPVFGPLLPSASVLFMPGWAIEGPTVNAETIYTAGGRGRNAFFKMGWVAPVLEGDLFTYDQAGTSSAYPPEGRIYTAGYMIVDHLYDEYGDRAFIDLNREFQAWPVLGMRRALRRTTGLRAGEFFNSMEEALLEEYAPRRLLPAGEPFSPPAETGVWQFLSAGDAGVYTYVRSHREPGALYLLPWGADAPQRITPLSPLDSDSIAVSPDGRTAVAALDAIDFAGEGSTVGYSDLMLFDLESGRSRRLTSHRRLYHPRIGPDGRIFALERVGSYSRLVEIDPESGALATRYAPTRRSIFTPALSTDGGMIALVENDRGRQDLLILETRGFTAVAVVGAPGPAAEYYPQFVTAEGGEQLWFGSDRDGDLALYAAELAGTGSSSEATTVTRLVGTPILRDRVGAFVGTPTPTSDIVYGSYRSNGYVIRRGAGISAADSTVPLIGRDPDNSQETEATHSATADPTSLLAEARPYRDLPRPVLWLPLASLTGGTDEQTVWKFGGFALAASNLGRHELSLSAYYAPATELVDGEMSYLFSPGATAYELSLIQTYDDELTVERGVSVSATRPLWITRAALSYRGLVARLGARYRSVGDTPYEDIAALGALRLFSRQFGSARDIFGGPGTEIRGSANLRLPYLDAPTTGYAGLGELELQRRLSPRAAPQLRTTLSVAMDSDDDALELLPYRAGRFSAENDNDLSSAASAVLGRLEFLVPLGVYDGAVRGAAFQRLGSSLYLEQEWGLDSSAQVDGADASFQPGSFTVPGIELVADLALNSIPFRLRSGVAAQIYHDGFATDLQFYLSVENIGGMDISLERDRQW